MGRNKVHNKAIIFPFVPDYMQIEEQFKGEAKSNPVTFPKALGEEHEFKFEDCEQTYKKFGLAKTAVDKHVDFILAQRFHLKTENEAVKELIEDLIDQPGFMQNLRAWIEEAFIKGNGFLEIKVEKETVNIKVINANNMYVVRDDTGIVTGYNQYVGNLDKFIANKKTVIPFKTNEIAHLPIHKVGDDAYGIGIIYPALKTIDYICKCEKDSHLLLFRKANSPIVAKIGSPEEPATQADVDALGQKLIWLTNLHEWAFNHNVELSMLDFGAIGEKFDTLLNYDQNMLFYIFQTPSVLMGTANVPEGLAKVQMDAFERRIQSIQDLIEEIIEEQIFKPFLNANGLEEDIEIEWGLPSEESINARLTIVTQLLGQMSISPELRALLEADVADKLGLDMDKIPSPEEMRKEKDTMQQQELDMSNKSRDKEETKPQPRVPSKQMKESLDIPLMEFVNLHELKGFNYADYKKYAIAAVDRDRFENLLATTKKEFDEGLLSEAEVIKLKEILTEAFQNNKSIREIEEQVYSLLDLSGSNVDERARANNIARTETVRLTNIGLLDMYKDNGVKEVRWLASISDRTCDECEAKNGQVFKLEESYGEIPLHPMCRCVFVSK